MSKEVLEPLAVGVWFNRDTTRSIYYDSLNEKMDSPRDKEDDEEIIQQRQIFGRALPTFDTSQYSQTWSSRLLAKFPFLVEVVYWLLIYLTYQFGRGIVVLSRGDGTAALAELHGIQILHLEDILHIRWEHSVQQWFLRHQILLNIFNRIYSWVHIPATIAFIGWLFHTVSHSQFARVRRTIAMANLLAFIVFTCWPAAPPRLLPESYGFIDTVHTSSARSVWNDNKFQNQLAAMPSLHFGYSWIIGVSLVAYMPLSNPAVNYLGFLYPLTILVAIVCTANHYILDAVAGLLVTLLAFAANGILLSLLPIENAVLTLLHTRRPVPEPTSPRRVTLSLPLHN